MHEVKELRARLVLARLLQETCNFGEKKKNETELFSGSWFGGRGFDGPSFVSERLWADAGHVDRAYGTFPELPLLKSTPHIIVTPKTYTGLIALLYTTGRQSL